MKIKEIKIYTDGSCNTKQKFGGWAAILIYNNDEYLITGTQSETTNNRMELTAAIKSLEYIYEQNLQSEKIIIYSDSQYVVNLINRKDKLVFAKFKTKANTDVRNCDLIELFFNLIDKLKPEFIKVKAHQKKTEYKNYNREVDKISRKLVRDFLNRNSRLI